MDWIKKNWFWAVPLAIGAIWLAILGIEALIATAKPKNETPANNTTGGGGSGGSGGSGNTTPAFDGTDKTNALDMYAAIFDYYGGTMEDEAKMLQIVNLYTVTTYPRLRAAYQDKYGKDLNMLLEEYLSTSQYNSIANIIGG